MDLCPDPLTEMTVFTMWLLNGPGARAEVRVLYGLVYNVTASLLVPRARPSAHGV